MPFDQFPANRANELQSPIDVALRPITEVAREFVARRDLVERSFYAIAAPLRFYTPRPVTDIGRVNGQYAYLEGLNVVGMRRRKFSRARQQLVSSFYRDLFRAPGVFADRLASARDRAKEDPAI